MAECDARAIASGTPGDVLMERAGSACCAEVVRASGGIYAKSFCVLVGPGNNGGDGFVVARLLRRAGAFVRCVLAAAPEMRARVQGDAATNLRRMEELGVALEDFTGELPRAHTYVDAVFGTGFRGEVTDTAAAAIAALPSEACVVAVDIPSGVDGATGVVAGCAVTADVTVAIQALKVGHVLEPGAGKCGRVVVADIGIELDQPLAHLADPRQAVALVPERARLAHKWSAGSVLVVGGSLGMGGAPTLTSLAATRAGAGLVTTCVPAPVQAQVASAVPEVMVVPLPADDRGRMQETSFGDVPGAGRFAAVALGPGLGRGKGVDAFVVRALHDLAQPTVLDADGLNAVAGEDLARRAGPTVVTPHDGEFERLGGDLGAYETRIQAAQAAADEWEATLLLKGPTTVVASPDREPVVCRGGGSELATAGTGDTLTGIIAAFVARGATPHAAAVAATLVHAEAGCMAAGDGRWVTSADLHDHLGAAERSFR